MGILGEILKLALGGGGQTAPQAGGAPKRQMFACKYCGAEYPSVRSLTDNLCQNHPAGKGSPYRHELYEGGVKQQYTCKHCGRTFRSLRSLTWDLCQRNPAGGKYHEPAL